MHLTIKTFDMGTTEEKARKVCEEAMEFYAEHACKNLTDELYMDTPVNLMMEIGDVFTALANYCDALNIDVQKCIDLVETKNILRGRYDND